MQEMSGLIACEECDALHRRQALGRGEAALCRRCGAELEREAGVHGRRALPLALAGIVVYVIANAFPIVEMEMQGIASRATLAGSVLALDAGGMPLVALLVMATTILFPLMQLLILAYLLLGVRNPVRPPAFDACARLAQALRPWAMVEVFLLGIVVALVKLSAMATVLPGVALWAFGALTVLLAAVSSLPPRYVWKPAALPGEEGSHVAG